VDEQQVEVVQAEAFEACLARSPGAVEAVPLLVELRGDKQLLARHAGGAQPAPDTALVLVVLCGVDQSVARLDRGRHDALDGGVVHRPGPEPELRNADRVGQREGGGGGCAHGCSSGRVRLVIPRPPPRHPFRGGPRNFSAIALSANATRE
jgi:hypothetical protein